MSRRLPDPVDVGDKSTQDYLQDLVRTLTVEVSDIEGEFAANNVKTPNGDVEAEGAGSGLLVTTPNGATQYRIRVDNAGNVTTEVV